MYVETMISPAIPKIIDEFNLPYNISAWLLTSYLVVAAVMTPIVGKITTIYGKKPTIVLLMVLYIFGILVAAFSPNFIVLLLGRALEGLGMAVLPIAFGIIRDQFRDEKLAIGQGIFVTMFYFGSVIGLVAGGYIVEYVGWRMTFFSIIPFSLLVVVFIIKFILLDEPIFKFCISKLREFDVKDISLLSITLASFLIIITNLQNLFSNFTNIFMIFVFLASLFLFIHIERKIENPIIDLKLFKNKLLNAANTIVTIIGINTFMVFHSIPILIIAPLPQGFGKSEVEVVNVFLPYMVTLLFFSIFAGFIISRYGNIKPTFISSIIMALGFFNLLFFHSSSFELSVNLFIVALGLSLTDVGSFNIALSNAPKHLTDISTALTMLFYVIGSSIGPALSGVILSINQSYNFEFTKLYPSPSSYIFVFLISCILSVVTILCLIYIRQIKVAKR